MGGWGSGRGQRGKDTTSDLRSLDVRRLQRDGLLTAGRTFSWRWTRNEIPGRGSLKAPNPASMARSTLCASLVRRFGP